MQKSNALNLTDVVAGYYKPTAASIAFSLALLSQLLGPDPDHILDDPLLQDRVDDALQKANIALPLVFQWETKQRLELMRRTGANDADNLTDRAVTSLYNAADNFRSMGPDAPLYKTADNLINLIMPQGVKPITSQRYENQYATINIILSLLDGPGKPAVEALNLQPFVEHLRDLNQQYGQSLTSTGNTGITYNEVQQATLTAQEAYALVILTIWTRFPFEQDRTLRNKLLAPIHEQNGRFRQHYARKSTPPRVDPQTGEFSDEEEDTLASGILTPLPINNQNLYPNLPGGFPDESHPN